MMDLIDKGPAEPGGNADIGIDSLSGKTSRDQSRELDQFYTRPDVATACMEKVREFIQEDVGTWLEPSAGTGVFLDLLPTPRIGLDLDPQHPEILCRDFLSWKEGPNLVKPVVTVGNPPFGRNSSLALKFVNEAAKFSKWICMILPRTFEKKAMQNKMSKHHELIYSEPLDSYSFIHRGEPYCVPCCFQIWKLLPKTQKRTLHRPEMTHPDFKFVENHEDADFAFQRVGVNAGKASKEGLLKSWKSNHFIKAVNGVDPDELMANLNSIDWKAISGKTAGNPSIGKGEMIEAYSIKCPPGARPGMFDFG